MHHKNVSTGVSDIDVVDIAAAGTPIPDMALTPTERTATESAGANTRNRAVGADRRARVRLLAGSALGVALLILALRLQPDGGSPFTAPSGPVACIAAISGLIGIWLVPGLWLSAVMVPAGAGLAAWLATRIGTTLAWYAFVGPLVHELAQGAQATTGVIFGMTAAATGAACIGVLVGLLPWPVDRRIRALGAAVVGAICAQAAIALAMWLWTYDVNYNHIRRLDWLIVLASAFLAAFGQSGGLTLPTHAAEHVRKIVVALNVLTITFALVLTVGSTWSPQQRMPSAFSAEQVTAPPGADLALALTGVGPDGARMLRQAVFAAVDGSGHPVQVGFRLVEEGQSADRATLLMVVDPVSRPVLCGPGGPTGLDAPVKLTVRDRTSDLLVQALIPTRWCAG